MKLRFCLFRFLKQRSCWFTWKNWKLKRQLKIPFCDHLFQFNFHTSCNIASAWSRHTSYPSKPSKCTNQCNSQRWHTGIALWKAVRNLKSSFFWSLFFNLSLIWDLNGASSMFGWCSPILKSCYLTRSPRNFWPNDKMLNSKNVWAWQPPLETLRSLPGGPQ